MSDELNRDPFSIRGLIDSGGGTPLRKFTAILDKIDKETFQAKNFKTGVLEPKTKGVLMFKEVEVLQSTEPYPFPVATIKINLSNQKNSGWGVFADSLAKRLPETDDLPSAVGKRMTLEMVDKDFGFKEKVLDPITNAEVEVAKKTGCWTVVWLEGEVTKGTGVAASVTRALELLDGKTMLEFNKTAFADPAIRADSALVAGLANKQWIAGMMEAKRVTKDDNEVYHVSK